MIRRALAADAQTVARIHVASWHVAYRGIMPDDVIARTDLAYRTAMWSARIADPEWPVLLLEPDGAAAAFCHMMPSPDPDDAGTAVGHITSLHVLPGLRGRGYGAALMDYVLAEFRRRGCEAVTLWVLRDNRNARRFYERHGFAPDGATQCYPATDVPEVRYRIRLSNRVPPS